MRSWQSYLINAALRLTVKRRKPGSVPLQKQRDDFETMMARQFKPQPGIEYREEELEGLPITWAEPQQQAASGTVLYLHGGGYMIGSPRAYRDLTGRIAAAAQCAVAALDYRLAPEHPHPAALEDALRCYRALRERGTDPASMAIVGDSAGGGLTLAALVALKQAGDPLPGAAVCFSPWTDLTGSGASVSLNAAADPMLTAAALRGMAQCYVPDGALERPLVSPLNADLSGLPPLLLFVSSSEILRDDAQRVADKIAAAGGSVQLEIAEGMPHVWPMFAARLPEGRQSIAAAARFIRSQLKSR